MICSLIHKTLSTKIIFEGNISWGKNQGRTNRFTENFNIRYRSMIPIVDDEKLQKRKASCTPQNTQTNTSWAVRAWFEWAKERSDFIQITGDSETIPYMKSIIFVDIVLHKFEFLLTEIWFQLVERRNVGSPEKLKFNWNKLQREFLWEWITVNFFSFGFVWIKSPSRGNYLYKSKSHKTMVPNYKWLSIQFISHILPCFPRLSVWIFKSVVR